MSAPNEGPDPEQPGYQPPKYEPPQYRAPDYQPPPGNQPPGYQDPGYQAPRSQQPPGGFRMEPPADMPRSFSDVIPRGGFTGLFHTRGLPTLLKISYILWLVTAAFWLLFTVFYLLGSIILLSARGVVSSIISLVLITVIVVFAMKLKEGLAWPRWGLTILAVVMLIFTGFGAYDSLLGVVATVLMWLPESTAWINSRRHVAG